MARNTEKNIATSVSGNGQAVADFDTARFEVVATGTGKTGPAAKTELLDTIKKLRDIYDGLEREGAAAKLKTHISVGPNWDYTTRGNKTLVGYVARYAMSFHLNNLDMVSDVHDRLTNVEGTEAHSPTFDVTNKSELSTEALRNAFEQVQKRFENECEVLGKRSSDFEIDSWNVYYNEDRGPVRAHSAMLESTPGASPAAIEINAGKAEIGCQLTVNYTRK